MKPESLISLILFDNGRVAPGLDGLAAAVAMFGQGRFFVASVHDRTAIRAATGAGAESIVVVNVDDDREPKQTLADLAGAGFPVVVLTDGRDETVAEHARSVGAAACLPMSLPARELISRLAGSIS